MTLGADPPANPPDRTHPKPHRNRPKTLSSVFGRAELTLGAPSHPKGPGPKPTHSNPPVGCTRATLMNGVGKGPGTHRAPWSGAVRLRLLLLQLLPLQQAGLQPLVRLPLVGGGGGGRGGARLAPSPDLGVRVVVLRGRAQNTGEPFVGVFALWVELLHCGTTVSEPNC